MMRLTRLIAALSAALAMLVAAGVSPAFAGWGETERITGLAALTEHPGPGNSAGALVPPLPLEITNPPGRRPPNYVGALTSGSRPQPVRVDVDSAGNLYVLSQGPGVVIEGPPYVNGRVARATDPGYEDCPAYQGFLQGSGYLYVASLVSTYRIDASSHEVTWLGTWLAQSEAGAPTTLFEASDPPAGLAVDRTAGAERLYISVPGSGILKRDLGAADAEWSVFVEDDHDVWLPYENGYGLGGDPFTPELTEYPLGEGAPSLVPCLSRAATPQLAVDAVYGTLWEGGPSVPASIAVDPSSGEVIVAEQAPQSGAQVVTEAGDRLMPAALRLRRFSRAGAALSDVDAAWCGTASSCPDGAARPLWLLDQGTGEDLDTRVGGMAFDRGGSLHVLNQVDALSGQIFRASRQASEGLQADAVFRADATRPFGPVTTPSLRGIEDLAIRPVSGGRYRYLVSPTSQAGLLELTSDGESNGTIGAALNQADPDEPCTFDNSRIRLAVDPRDGSVLVLRQPTGTGSSVILRLDAQAAEADCETTTPPEEVEPTDPVLTVVGARYKGDAELEPVSGSEFAFSPTADGETIELDDEEVGDGWLFSVRVTDEDNAGADFGLAAGCAVERNVPRPVTSEASLRGGACRPTVDTAVIQGSAGNGANGQFTVTKDDLRDPATGEGRTADFTVTITDDEGATATTSFRVKLKTAVRAPLEITRFDSSPVGGDARFAYRFNHTASGLQEWQLDLGGENVSPSRVPADGWSSSALPAQSPAVTFPGPGTYPVVLRIRRNAGTPAEETVEQRLTIFIGADTTRDATIVPVQSGAACDTPLGTPLAQLGLGDPQLCVPADPCDVNAQALGLTRLPIVRPDSCAGADGDLFAGSAAGAGAAAPQGSRPSVISSSLRLGRDRRIAVRVRCGTGPTVCAGRLRITLTGGKAPRTVGSAVFTGLRSQRRTTVRVRVSAATARRLRRGSSRIVQVSTEARVPAGFAVPKTQAKRLRLYVSPTRTARR